VGVTLPQFRYDAETAVAAARRAEELGLDGVFVFDHMWPMGRPDRPLVASVPLLGALAIETSRVAVGSLVMGVGLVPDEVLVAALLRVDEISGGRLVAGLGTGDRLSAAENRAFGVAYPPASLRRQSLEWCAAELRSAGRPVWIGAGAVVSAGTREVAVRVGAAVNVWNTGTAAVAAEDEVEVTWGGPLAGGPLAVATRIGELADAGATWVVCGWPDSLDVVAEACEMVRNWAGAGGGPG
jgi:hypothetical protein